MGSGVDAGSMGSVEGGHEGGPKWTTVHETAHTMWADIMDSEPLARDMLAHMAPHELRSLLRVTAAAAAAAEAERIFHGNSMTVPGERSKGRGDAFSERVDGGGLAVVVWYRVAAANRVGWSGNSDPVKLSVRLNDKVVTAVAAEMIAHIETYELPSIPAHERRAVRTDGPAHQLTAGIFHNYTG